MREKITFELATDNLNYNLSQVWRSRMGARHPVAQVAQIFGGVNTLSGYVGTESVSAEFSTTASEP